MVSFSQARVSWALIRERKWSLSFFFSLFRSVESGTMFRKMIEFRSIYLIRHWIDYTWKRNRVNMTARATKQKQSTWRLRSGSSLLGALFLLATESSNTTELRIDRNDAVLSEDEKRNWPNRTDRRNGYYYMRTTSKHGEELAYTISDVGNTVIIQNRERLETKRKK